MPHSNSDSGPPDDRASTAGEIVAAYDLVWKKIDGKGGSKYDKHKYNGETLIIRKYTVRSFASSAAASTAVDVDSSPAPTVPDSDSLTYKAFFSYHHIEVIFSCSASADETEFEDFEMLECNDDMREGLLSLRFQMWDVKDDDGFPFMRWCFDLANWATNPEEPEVREWAKRRAVTALSEEEQTRLEKAMVRYAWEIERESVVCELIEEDQEWRRMLIRTGCLGKMWSRSANG